MNDIYNRIRKRREELHMTQDELAAKLGYKSRSSINKIEMGKNDISRSKIAEFACALAVSPAYLMGWDEKPDNKYIDEMIPLLKQLPEVMQMQMLAMVKVLIIQQDGNEEKFIKSIFGEDDETTK